MNKCRLCEPASMIDEATLGRYASVTSSAVSDCMERVGGAVDMRAIAPVPWTGPMVGTALTVRTRAGDNLAVHKALDLARPGHVVVVDAGGDTARAIIGEIMCTYAAQRGVHGMVVDGAVRDSGPLSRGIFPVFARGVTHVGPYKSGPGEIHGTVSIGGTPVRDGDLVMGDEDGVVFVPRRRIDEVIVESEHVVASEQQKLEQIPLGSYDRSWVDAAIEIVAG